MLLRFGVHVKQALYLTALDDVLLDEFFHVRGLDLDVEGVVGSDLDDGSLFAETETA